jgi:hypothetical protein
MPGAPPMPDPPAPDEAATLLAPPPPPEPTKLPLELAAELAALMSLGAHAPMAHASPAGH